MAGVQSATSRKWMPSAASSGRSESFQQRDRLPIIVRARPRMAISCCSVLSPSGEQVLDAGAVLLEQRRQPHHEELVEVGADDAEELDPLEQRVRGVPGLRQHALVELEPASARG